MLGDERLQVPHDVNPINFGPARRLLLSRGLEGGGTRLSEGEEGEAGFGDPFFLAGGECLEDNLGLCFCFYLFKCYKIGEACVPFVVGVV